MLFEFNEESKFETTCPTLLGHGAGVHLLMFAQALHISKALVAPLAGEWFGVDALVNLDCLLTGEPLPALGAAKRLLPGVDAHVSREVATDVERGRALGAREAARPRVGEGVSLEVLIMTEADATGLTAKGLVPLMDSHVAFKRITMYGKHYI